MTTKKLPKGGTTRKAEGSRGSKLQLSDGALARRVLGVAYRSEEERDDAARGTWWTGGALDAIIDISNELSVLVIHPDILPAALPVIIAAAREKVASRGGSARVCHQALRNLARAAAKGGAR